MENTESYVTIGEWESDNHGFFRLIQVWRGGVLWDEVKAWADSDKNAVYYEVLKQKGQPLRRPFRFGARPGT
jgi:hypothetical protein